MSDLRLAKAITFKVAMSLGAVKVRCDGRACAGLPDPYASDPQLVLQFNREASLGLTVDDDGLHATMSFSGVVRLVEVPWDAIGMVWEDAPSSRVLLVMPIVEIKTVELEVETVPVEKPRPRFGLVPRTETP